MKYLGFTGSILLLMALIPISINLYKEYEDINKLEKSKRKERAGIVRTKAVLYSVLIYAVTNMMMWFFDNI